MSVQLVSTFPLPIAHKLKVTSQSGFILQRIGTLIWARTRFRRWNRANPAEASFFKTEIVKLLELEVRWRELNRRNASARFLTIKVGGKRYPTKRKPSHCFKEVANFGGG